MTTLFKRLTLAGGIAIVLILTFLFFAPAGGRRYRAESCVVARPYTNAFFARSFEAQIVQTIPSVLRLRVTPIFSGIPGSGAPVATNGTGIRIITTGPTAAEAQRAANDAAAQICRTVLTNYGVTGEIVEMATTSRSYSYFHDSFQPAVSRLFKH